MRILLLNILLLCLSFTICAQTNPYKEIKKGNKQYLKTEYNNAIKEYEETLKKDESSFIANYNIANVLYKNADVSKDSTW